MKIKRCTGFSDTNGETNTISGEVERSGVLWVENLPLNSGTNWITLNVTNAAGLANTTNLYVVKSDMTLTVTSISGDLWVPPVNVYGTVSDTSAAIWVNGVQGTNYGDGTWEVDNVPVSASGVASFDVSAVPAGGGDPDFNTNVIKDAEVVIVKYQDNKSVLTTNAIYGDSGIYTRTKDYQLNYAANNSGQEFLTGYQGTTEDFNYSYNSYFDNYGNLEHDASSREDDYGWTVTNMYWSHTVDGVNGIYTNFNDSGVISVPDVDLYEFGWLGDSSGYDGYAASLIYHYYANNVRQEIVYADGTVENLAVDARTTMKLFTGGRAGVNRQSLICVSASATEYGRQGDWAESSVTPWLGVPESGVSASSIRVLGKNLGADGNLWLTLPDNASPDLFIAAPPRHYNATASVQKYRLKIQVNSGNFLLPDQVPSYNTYCVGQKLTFTPYWFPSDPPFVEIDSTFHWTLPDTNKYVNWSDSTDPIGGQGTEYYTNLDSLLASETTSCWYVDALQAGTASVDMSIQFDNGQIVPISTLGQFSVYKPSISFKTNLNNDASLPSVDIDTSGDTGPNSLMVGTYSGTGQMNFGAYVKSKFPGEVMTTQLIKSSWTAVLYDAIVFGPFGTSDEFWLDKIEAQSHGTLRLNSDGTFGGFGRLVDQPATALRATYYSLTRNDSFKTYFRFRPSGDGSIYVTLGLGVWSWYGTAIEDSDPTPWSLISGAVTGPSIAQSDEFPIWGVIYH